VLSSAELIRHDSLYAIGGMLTMECRGKLKPIPNIDNRFLVTSDTLKPNGDSVQTKRILIDRDPPNSLFLDSLHYDIIKAIAWIEYAGSNDTRHCHNPYNPHYNNYWDHVIAQGDTCIDSLTPCENIASTATGTMQMLRGTWERVFNGSMPDEPLGYTRCIWDSLAWNWKANIHNGKYIHFANNPAHFQSYKKQWDSICVMCNPADSLPLYKNREDLSTYGYKNGSNAMRQVTAENWVTVMKSKEGKYVRDVRGGKHSTPWQ
jgi:hypothetical protein